MTTQAGERGFSGEGVKSLNCVECIKFQVRLRAWEHGVSHRGVEGKNIQL